MGQFWAAANGNLEWCTGPLVAEALAFRREVQLGQYLGLREVFVEGDSQAVVNMINGTVTVNQEVKIIVNDIQTLSRCFASCIFSYSCRSSNSVAHLLASKGLFGVGYSLWTEFPPFGFSIPYVGMKFPLDV